jgi:hypothetical protein
MKCSLRWSPCLAALVVAALVLCVPWQSLGQTKKGAGAPPAKKSATAKGAAGAGLFPKPAPKKTPAAKTSPEAVPAKPSPETEILEKIPPELQDPLTYPAPAKPEPPGPRGPYRVLAPGVMIAIPPDRNPEDSVDVHNVVELQQHEWARGIRFRRDVWALEFRFKPVRILDVDVPQPSGKMQRKPIWYLVYSVTNRGKVMEQVEQPDRTYKLAFADKVEEAVPQSNATLKREPVEEPTLFAPEFLFESINTGKRYPDRVIPVAMAAIALREDPNRQFYNTVEITRPLKLGGTVWGIATWEDVDPGTDRFSIYVAGLTNAYQWTDQPGAYKKGDPPGTGQDLWRRTLKLNFWRPGDAQFVDESQIRFGIPGEPSHVWMYCDAEFREKPQPSGEKPQPPGTAEDLAGGNGQGGGTR